MIPCTLGPEPEEFDARCRQRGLAWLGEHPDVDRPYDLWSAFKPELARSFADLCAYSAMCDLVGTVDHFESWQSIRKTRPELAYEWSNFRYASGWLNSAKKEARVLDPLAVGPGWFEIILPSLQLIVTDAVPEGLRELARYTTERLGLRDDERVMRQRREWYRMYQSGELTLEGLKKKAPLIAAAVERDAAARATTSST